MGELVASALTCVEGFCFQPEQEGQVHVGDSMWVELDQRVKTLEDQGHWSRGGKPWKCGISLVDCQGKFTSSLCKLKDTVVDLVWRAAEDSPNQGSTRSKIKPFIKHLRKQETCRKAKKRVKQDNNIVSLRHVLAGYRSVSWGTEE